MNFPREFLLQFRTFFCVIVKEFYRCIFESRLSTGLSVTGETRSRSDVVIECGPSCLFPDRSSSIWCVTSDRARWTTPRPTRARARTRPSGKRSSAPSFKCVTREPVIIIIVIIAIIDANGAASSDGNVPLAGPLLFPQKKKQWKKTSLEKKRNKK